MTISCIENAIKLKSPQPQRNEFKLKGGKRQIKEKKDETVVLKNVEIPKKKKSFKRNECVL